MIEPSKFSCGLRPYTAATLGLRSDFIKLQDVAMLDLPAYLLGMTKAVGFLMSPPFSSERHAVSQDFFCDLIKIAWGNHVSSVFASGIDKRIAYVYSPVLTPSMSRGLLIRRDVYLLNIEQ